MTHHELVSFAQSVEKHLTEQILPFWMHYTVDETLNGFIGYMDGQLRTDDQADKGAILNSRILWTFSRVCQHFGEAAYLDMARRAYQYLVNHFWDKELGGVFWSVNFAGQPKVAGKHIYNQAFAIYGLAEYYAATGEPDSLRLAIQLFNLVEKYAYDDESGGYMESFDRFWNVSDRLLLSAEEGLFAQKSMNTHLHLLEAYANLFRVWKDEALQRQLTELAHVLMERVLNDDTFQFTLFFDRRWHPVSNKVSFGHDIEGSWLLTEAAQILGDVPLRQMTEGKALKMAEQVYFLGLDDDGALLNEARNGKITDDHKVWWVQAEALVGFINAYQLGGDRKFLTASKQLWSFIQQYIIDKRHGEWHWRLKKDRRVDASMPVVEHWKCPYHNSRACMEVIDRIKLINENV